MTTSPGEQRRDEGAARADNSNKLQSLVLRLSILEIASMGEPFTADDIPGDEDEQRNNRTGSAFLNLSKAGFIVFSGQCRRSTRLYRHAGLLRVWQTPDVAKCRNEAAKIKAELAKLEPPAQQGDLFGQEGEVSP